MSFCCEVAPGMGRGGLEREVLQELERSVLHEGDAVALAFRQIATPMVEDADILREPSEGPRDEHQHVGRVPNGEAVATGSLTRHDPEHLVNSGHGVESHLDDPGPAEFLDQEPQVVLPAGGLQFCLQLLRERVPERPCVSADLVDQESRGGLSPHGFDHGQRIFGAGFDAVEQVGGPLRECCGRDSLGQFVALVRVDAGSSLAVLVRRFVEVPPQIQCRENLHCFLLGLFSDGNRRSAPPFFFR